MLLFLSIGAPLVLCRKIGDKMNKAPANFAFDNILLRKLFTAHPKFNPHSNYGDKVENQSTFAHFLDTRASFYYSYKSYCRRKLSKCWCLCCCICFSRKLSTIDKMYRRARTRMYHELDILHILKQLRI